MLFILILVVQPHICWRCEGCMSVELLVVFMFTHFKEPLMFMWLGSGYKGWITYQLCSFRELIKTNKVKMF